MVVEKLTTLKKRVCSSFTHDFKWKNHTFVRQYWSKGNLPQPRIRHYLLIRGCISSHQHLRFSYKLG